MATTRSSTPDGDVSEPASPQLSPRSKLRAELAAIDDQYPKETPNGPIDVKALFESIDRTRGANDDATRAQDAPQDVNEDETEDEDEEEDIIQPRGRLAARMLAGRARDAPAPELSRPTKIPPKHASEPIHKASPTEHASEENQSEEDDDDEVTALPRRRLNKRVRGTTPESAAAEAEPPSSPSLFVSQSPRNSFTAAVAEYNSNSDSDDEVPADLTKSDRFKALVAKKRAERLAKEAEEERKREERARRIAEQMPADSDVEDDDASDISDDAGGRKLTQDVSRPARKASKKALEEMNRETQRLSRSLQLAHEAKTKKKITKASLFERFNFMANKAQNQPAAAPTNLASSSRPTTPGSGHHTEVEVVEGNTPPSSPPGAPKLAPGPSAGPGPETVAEEDEDDELPSILTALKRPQQKVEGKGKDVEVASKPHGVKEIELPKAKRQVRVRLPTVQTNLVTLDSGDELEITKPKKGRLDAVFDKIPEKKAQEPMSMSILRHLAHLSSPPKADSSRGRNTKPSMTSGELQMTLQQRARAQAKLERERRLEYLRSKGVVVQSTEQRERERQQVEDIVDRARQEVEEIMQRERDDAKQARKERRMNGEDDALDWDDSDDESFKGSEEDKPDEAEAEELEFSGSEDEGDEDEDNNEKSRATNLLFQEEAEEDESEEEIPKDIEQDAPENADDEDDSPGSLLSALKTRRPKKRARVISDDEDEDAIEATPRPKTAYIQSPAARDADSPILPKSVLRSATKNFIPGLPIANAAPAGLGLTQIFAGTMDESQASQVNGSPQEFMPTLGEFPDSQFSATAEQSQNDGMVLNSQPTEAEDTQTWDSQGVQLHYSQSQVHGFDSFMQSEDTQFSQTIEPTQDGGFQDFSPLKQRFVEAPQSTVDTVLLGDNAEETTAHDSPLVKKHTRLRRRGDYATSASSLPPTEIPGSQSTMPPALSEADKPDGNAFRLMEKAARREKRRQKKFDKKKSKATEMIEEQAEESEDEYAGLGGMDGEDSSEDDEELRKEMIDDTAGNNVDEAKLAGFFADRERAADAAQVDKLFRDITTGMLRKRRRGGGGGGGGGNDYDLSDSDDGGEARRRMKQRQFAKMQKALFADERIGKIAENPRNAAFLKSIEDRGSDDDDDELDFDRHFFAEPPTEAEDESQPQPQPQQQDQGGGAEEDRQREQEEEEEEEEAAVPDSQPQAAPAMGRKRTRMDDGHAARPPPNARRTKGATASRPSSLTEVRKSLSSLLEEPNASVGSSVIPASEVGSDGEDDEHSHIHNKENRRSTTVPVVDRIALKRNASSLLSNSGTGASASTSRLAFAAPSSSLASGSGSFKVPALLRRATANSLASSASASSSSLSTTARPPTTLNKAASFSEEGGKVLKLKSAGRRSGINHLAREGERRAKVAEAERRREERKFKGAEGRGRLVGGLFGAGRFE